MTTTMKKKKPTLKTIAYMTGLAVTTVSKALKDAPDIKESTKERVRLIAKEVGYHPDRAGQRLRTGKSNVIALLIDTEAEMFSMSSDFISGVSAALKGTPYFVVLAPVLHDEDPLATVRHLVDTQAADGLILTSIEKNDQRLAYLTEVGMPFVTHGRSNMGIEHAYYDFDCQSFGRDAVQILAGLGAKKVSLVSPPSEYSYALYMQQGFYEGVEKAGLESRIIQFDHTVRSIEKIAERITSMMKNYCGSDGVVCPSPSAAVGVIGGVEAAGLEVGKDVHIVAKQTPKNMLRWFGRKVHTINEDFKTCGFELATSLVKIIDGAPVTDHQQLVYPGSESMCVLCGAGSCGCIGDYSCYERLQSAGQ